MHITSILSAIPLALLPSLVAASNPPSYSGYTAKWYANFIGNAGSAPSSDNWNVITGNLGVNGELETYSSASKNVQRSGKGTLQLAAYRDSSAKNGWTSGRIESKYTFTPKQSAKTIAEARINFGSNPKSKRQGLWPAFWLLGQALRTGGSWPSCGEVDVMETVNGVLTGHGTIHCNKTPGGICNEPSGLGAATALADYGWHVWRVVWDNSAGASAWQKQSINFYLDGKLYHTVTGSQINNKNVWNSLAHSPMYFILNLAVGGSWPGSPNSDTVGGTGSMMEVDYVAHYEQS